MKLNALLLVCAVVPFGAGCAGLFHLTLRTKKDPPPLVEYTEFTVFSGYGENRDRFYFFKVPEWGPECVQTSASQAKTDGYWYMSSSTEDVLIWLKKNDRDLLQTTCSWEYATIMKTAKESGAYGSYLDVVASSAPDHDFTMDCEFFDKAVNIDHQTERSSG